MMHYRTLLLLVFMTVAQAAPASDALVGPVSLNAIDYCGDHPKLYIVDDDSAPSGQVVLSEGWLQVGKFPFPQTSKPVTIAMRIKPAFAGDEYVLETTKAVQPIAQAKAQDGGRWQWLVFPAVTLEQMGESFQIESAASVSARGIRTIDRIVITTAEHAEVSSLDSAPNLLPSRPMAQVSRTDQAPVIDGKSGDACWKGAVALSDFAIVGSLAPAEGKTTVRMLYDDKNLYVMYENHEPILDPVGQRTHEFKSSITEHDAEMWLDECVMMLLDPANTGDQAFDIWINPLGTTADASCGPGDLWESRDATWNPNVTAAAVVGDGSWTIEFAIPFADLNDGQTPTDGETWRAVIGRNARARNEQSSWDLCPRGFHDAHPMATLRFSEQPGALMLTVPESLSPGENAVEVMVPAKQPAAGGIYFDAAVSNSARKTSHSGQVIRQTLTHQLNVRQEGIVEVAYSALDAATLRPIYLSPAKSRSVRSSTAALELSCDGPYELYINGQIFMRGNSARGETITAPLRKGDNLFAIKVANGAAALKLTPPGLPIAPGNWKMAPAETKDAVSPQTDDSTWATAMPIEGETAYTYGQPWQSTVFRQTILYESSQQWPPPNPALFIASGSSQHLTLKWNPLEGRTLNDWTIYLAVPPEFEFVGSTGFYNWRSPYIVLPEQEIDGKRMRIIRIGLDYNVTTGRKFLASLVNAFVRYPNNGPKLPAEGTRFIFWTEANDRTVIEPPQQIPVRVLPELKGRLCKELTFEIWDSYQSAMNDLAVREASHNTQLTAGFNNVVGYDRWGSDYARRHGTKNTNNISERMGEHNRYLAPYLEKHPEMRLTRGDGTRHDAAMCTSALLAEGWECIEAILKEVIETTQVHVLEYDYEWSPYASHHSCFCARCIDAFRDHAKLAESDAEKLSSAVLADPEGPFNDQWADFMSWRLANIFLKCKETTHRLAPGTEFAIYSGYQSDETRRLYTVNWKYIGDLKAADIIGCGYGRPLPDIFDTIDAIQGIPALFGQTVLPYDVSSNTPLNAPTKATLLRRLVDARGGILLFDRMPMDGRVWLAVGETTRMAAEHEDLFMRGKRSNLGELDPAEVTVVSDENTTLICVMNERSSSREWRLNIPSDFGAGQEFYTGTKVGGGDEILCRLQPGESAVYVLPCR